MYVCLTLFLFVSSRTCLSPFFLLLCIYPYWLGYTTNITLANNTTWLPCNEKYTQTQTNTATDFRSEVYSNGGWKKDGGEGVSSPARTRDVLGLNNQWKLARGWEAVARSAESWTSELLRVQKKKTALVVLCACTWLSSIIEIHVTRLSRDSVFSLTHQIHPRFSLIHSQELPNFTISKIRFLPPTKYIVLSKSIYFVTYRGKNVPFDRLNNSFSPFLLSVFVKTIQFIFVAINLTWQKIILYTVNILYFVKRILIVHRVFVQLTR